MAELIIFTNNFPYGNGEAFIETEIVYLSNTFNSIHIFPLFYGNRNINKHKHRKVPANVSFSEPFINFDLKKDRVKYMVNGIFNLSQISFAGKEFFKKKVYRNFNWLKNWLGSVLLTRILLKPNNQKKIKNEITDNSVLYFYWGDKSSNIVPFVRKTTTNPIVVKFHGSDLYEETKSNYIPFRAELIDNITTAVFISNMGENYLKKRYPMIDFNSKVFKLGVKDLNITKQSTDNVLRVVSCSSVTPVKRLHLIIETLNQLDIDVIWTHLGGGENLKELMNLSKNLRPNIKTVFSGQLDNADVINFYENNPVDLFINVSASEGIPVSIMEAISTGIPVIATDVGGNSEIIDEKFGWLIPKDFSVKYLADIILEYNKKSISEKNTMKLEAKNFWAENYSAEKNYNDFSNFLHNLKDI